MRLSFILILTILIAGFVTVSATIINVPDDYGTIQEGIDASHDGDTVLVADGIYSGAGNYNISIGGHALTLMSENGAAACTISPGGPENRCFIFLPGLDQSTIVDGFTVYNGTSQAPGAGVYCYQNSSPAIRNCTFIYMVSYNNGGAIYLSANSNATIENCVFDDNTSYESGGAIFCYSNSATIEDCRFISNDAIRGGAIVCMAGGSPLIRNCEFNGNYTLGEGGSIYIKGSTPEISNCTITNVWMASDGAGIFCDSSANAYIHNSTISYNSCSDYGNGICCRNSNPNIVYCLFAYNRESNYGGGGIACLENSRPSISNCTFYRNMAEQGGGIFSINSTVTLTNSILWYNETDDGYSEIDFTGGAPIVSYCDVFGSWPGEGNLDCDPIYCYPDTGNYYLHAASCCRGAGEAGSHIGAFGIGCGELDYYPGDANMYNGAWPPQCNSSDVTYLVGYFRGVSANQPCYLDDFWASADANGDCNIIGSDVTRLVNYFRGNTTLLYCVDYEPAWPTEDDLPPNAPSGWPNCEVPTTGRIIPSGAFGE